MKIILVFLFLITIGAYFLELPMEYWVILTFASSFISLLNFFNRFKYSIPYGELLAFIILLENALSLIILYLLLIRELNYTARYYLNIPINQYIPYGLMASQAFLLGYTFLSRPDHMWIDFINNLSKKIHFKTIIFIFAFSFSSAFINFLHFSALAFVSEVLSNLGLCCCLAFYLYGKGKQSTYALLIGLGLNVISTINSGMFTGLTRFLIMMGMVYLTKNSNKNISINWFRYLIIAVIGFLAMAFLQNLKGDYRNDAWGGKEVGASLLLGNISKNYDKADITNKKFYFPILYRTNQAWLVSCTMEKVPIDQPFENGQQILTSFLDALLPRIINPDKQEAGGFERIKKYTNLILTKGTSMGIGYLGESYINFGVIGGVICMGCLGLLFSYVEKTILITSKKYPLLLIPFPFYVLVLLGSGNDFFWIFNNLIMGSIIIAGVVVIFSDMNKQFLKEAISEKKQTIAN